MSEQLRRGTSIFLAATVGLAAALVGVSAAEADPVTPPELSVKVAGYNGSGCSATNGTARPGVDKQSVEFTFGSFAADTAAGSLTKACSVLLDIQHSAGYAWAPTGFTLKGRLDVEDGAKAVQTSSYFFQGSDEIYTLATPFDGPVQGPYTANDDSKPTTWYQCGPTKRLFYVKSSLAVQAGPAGERAFISIDGQEITASKIQLKWKRC